MIFRLLFELTVDYPAIGIPLDLIILAVIISVMLSQKDKPSSYSSNSRPAVKPSLPSVDTAAAFAGLRHFDPNFSEILFTDFVYALYARVQERAGGRTSRASRPTSPLRSCGSCRRWPPRP